MKYARKQPTNDAASARGVERLLDATLDRLHTAERRLWEMSLEGDGDALLPPALFQAALAAGAPPPPSPAPPRRDVSSLYDGRPATSPRTARVATPRGVVTLPAASAPTTPRGATARPAFLAHDAGAASVAPRSAREAARRLPPTRADAVALDAALARRIAAEGEGVEVYDEAFGELVRQVGLQCAERGEVLGRVRGWLLGHVWWQQRRLHENEQQVHGAAATSTTTTTTPTAAATSTATKPPHSPPRPAAPSARRWRSSSTR